MIDRIVANLKLIAEQQQEDGSFLSESRSDSSTKIRKTTFFTSQIICCLNEVGRRDEYKALVHPICEKGVGFLLSERSPQWSWNYWSKEYQSVAVNTYPDDLDDTLLALTALHGYDPELITGEVMGFLTEQLMELEQKVGGPYFTWLVESEPDSVWRDLDVVVNARIALFLELLGVRLPALRKWLRVQIEQAAFESPYYPGGLQAQYLLKQIFPRYISLRNLANTNYSELDQILVSLIDSKKQVQLPEKAHWSPYCRDPKENGERYMAGSSALTAAFLIQALVGKEARGTEKTLPRFTEQVKKTIHGAVATLPQPLGGVAEDYYKAFLKKDTKREKSLLAWRVSQAIGMHFEDDFYHELALLNIHGWVAFTLLDQVWDNESNPIMTGVASWALRQVVYSAQRVDAWLPGFSKYAEKFLQRMEVATTWEVQNCRFNPEIELQSLPDYADYSILVERSLGEALSGCAVIGRKYDLESTQVTQWLQFFHAYTLSRQLNDDAHDWQEDLAMGYCNSVATMVIGTTLPFSYSQNLGQMQTRFWQDTIVKVAEMELAEIAQAEQSLKAFCTSPEWLLPLLETPRRAAEVTINEHQKTADFLKVVEAHGDTM